MFNMDLSGKVALVTGGAIRVGKRLALALADAGADIVISWFGIPVEAEETKNIILSKGRKCLSIEANMRSVSQLQDMVSEIESAFGRLDIVVHNAGNFNCQPFEEVTEEIWDSSMETILKGALFLSQAAAPVMLKHGFGKFIAIVGNSYHENLPNYIVHGIAKNGLAKLMQGLSLTYSPQIQAYAICPDTIFPMYDDPKLKANSKRASTLTVVDEDTVEKGGILLKKGNPDDLAELIVFLSGCTNYLNGNVIIMDGGKSLF